MQSAEKGFYAFGEGGHTEGQWGTASANTLAVFPPYKRIVAFTGSAIAAG